MSPQVDTILLQGSGCFNEDRVLNADNLFGVFDGASSLVQDRYRNRSGAWWAAEVACEEFSRNDDELLALARNSNRKLKRTMQEHGVNTHNKLECWSTSAAVFRIHGETLEWIQTGDCLIMGIDHCGGYQLLTPYHNHDAETLQAWQQLPHETHTQALERLRPRIEQVRMRMNKDYGVISGDERAENFFHQGRGEVGDYAHVLAFSDGLFPPAKADEDPDFAAIAECYLRKGLTGVARWVRQQECNDPHCRAYPRFKPHDDISAVAVAF